MNAQLVLVGEDHGMGTLLRKQAESLGIADKVHFTGHIHRRMLISAYAGCTALVLPSEYEAFGLVLLEAMASKKPCIATNVGGIPEVINSTCGILVRYGDVNALRDAMLTLLTEPEVAQSMGEKGWEIVNKNFSWRKTTEMLLKIYMEVVE